MIFCNSSDRFKARQRAHRNYAELKPAIVSLGYTVVVLILMIPMEVW